MRNIAGLGAYQKYVQNEISRIKNWRHHGLGMLQGEIDDLTRVHIWDPSLRTIPFEGYRDVHDHRFDLHSGILLGEIEDIRYHVSAAFEGEGDTDAWEIKHAKIQAQREGIGGDITAPLHIAGSSFDSRLERPAESERKPSHGALPDPKVPEADTRYIGRASVTELSRVIFRQGMSYEIMRRQFHTTRVRGFAVTLVRRSNFDERPARILGKGFSAIVRFVQDDPAQKTHDDLVASLVDRAVREVRGLR